MIARRGLDESAASGVADQLAHELLANAPAAPGALSSSFGAWAETR